MRCCSMLLQPLHVLACAGRVDISLAFAASEVTEIVAIRGSSIRQLLQ